MASPAVVGTPLEFAASVDQSTFGGDISSLGSGTLCIFILAVDGNPSVTWDSGGLYPFTEFGVDDHGGAFVVHFAYRVLDGTEMGFNGGLGASEKSACIVFEISGAADPATQPPEVTTFQSPGTSATPDPPSITPTGGSKDYLFIAGFVQDGEEIDDDTWSDTSPTNYTPSPPYQKTSGTGGAAGTNVSLAAATRQLTASSENPGTFAADVLHNYVSFTIAVHPAAPSVVLPPKPTIGRYAVERAHSW